MACCSLSLGKPYYTSCNGSTNDHKADDEREAVILYLRSIQWASGVV